MYVTLPEKMLALLFKLYRNLYTLPDQKHLYQDGRERTRKHDSLDF